MSSAPLKSATSPQDSWLKFLHPETLRANLTLASMFIASYEILKDSIVEQIQSFYTHEWDAHGPVLGKSYKREVLSLHPQHNRFWASIAWLQKNKVIDEKDEQTIRELTAHRNEVAHELPRFLSDVGRDFELRRLEEIAQLITKIDRWWIINVELEIQDGIDPTQVDAREVYSGNMMFLHLLIGIVTGAEEYKNVYEQVVQSLKSKEGHASICTNRE